MCLSGLDLLEELGRGGMGVVYRARQVNLDRQVAVKVLLGAQFAGPDDRTRFRKEAQSAASLQHPGIVGILDFGEDDGLPWYSMEIVEGENLETAFRSRPITPHHAATLVAAVADAVQHAHDRGILHRDLKPSNILLDNSGQPRITDFGIARSLLQETDAATATRTGQMSGTPGYAAPEQALRGQADARTDVYGLGSLLYHLLTGRPPFHGPTAESILLQLSENDPMPPRAIHTAVPRDLETICLKCLRKPSAARYASAADLSADLRRFLRNEPISARPPSLVETSWRWMARHPAVASLLFLVFFLTAGLVGASLWFARETARAEHRASLLAEARSLRQTRLAGSRARALENLREAWKITPSPEIRHDAVASLALADLRPLAPGTMVPAPAGHVISVLGDGLAVRDHVTGRTLATFGGIDPSSLATTDESGTRLAVSARGSGLLRLLAADNSVLATCQHPMAIEDIAWRGNLIATTCANRFIYIWDTSGNLKHRLSGHDAPGIRVAFRPRGQELASTAADNHVRLWHAARGTEILRLEHSHAAYTRLQWSDDGRHLIGHVASGSPDVFEWAAPAIVDVLSPPQEEPHSENLGSADLSADGRFAAVVDENHARIWDFDSGQISLEYKKETGQWLGVKFHPRANMLFTCGWADPLRRWPISVSGDLRAAIGPAIPLMREHGHLLRALSADGSLLALSNNATGTYTVVDSGGKTLSIIRQPATLACTLAGDGTWLATSSYEHPGVRIWSIPGGKPIRQICHNDFVTQTLPLGPARLAAKSSARIRIFDTNNWQELPGPTAGIRLGNLASTQDGRLLAGLGDHDIRILETTRFTEILRLTPPAHAGWLGECHVTFDEGGRHLLVHTALGCVMRWNLPRIARELQQLGIDCRFLPADSKP